MVWTQKVNITGPEGPPGDPGEAVEIRTTDTHIQWRLGESGEWVNLIALADLRGADGTSVNIVGSVEDAEALPDDLGPEDAGDGYITLDDGHLHVWDGTVFIDVGEIRGPQGEPGEAGADGEDGANGLSVELRVNGGNIEWRQTGGDWVTLTSLASITGPAGDDGADGADGLRGTQWFTGEGDPGTVEGSAVGDLYLNTTTGIVWVLE